MTSSLDDSVLDFDLNFLNQNSNGATVANTADQNKFEKQRRNMSLMKKKIIATDLLIAKYYAKKQMLYEAEKNLAATKEECKQICLDYRNALEKCSQLENERQSAHNAYKNVEERCGQLENQCKAYQSHINQLQQLIKEKDSVLDTLRVEKKKTVNLKEFDKKLLFLEREKTSLNKDVNLFADLIKKILGKRKLKPKYNSLLRKYELHNDGNISDSSDIFEEPFSPPPPVIHTTKKSTNVATDFECDNSIDTGRGSSIASDNEKCMLSPDYFINDCPSTTTTLATIENRPKINVTNVATSPIVFEETIEMEEASEIEEAILIDDDEEKIEFEDVYSNTEKQLSLVDRGLSPIQINTSRSVATSPMENKQSIVQIEIQNEFESKDASTITDFQTSSLNTIDRAISPINMTTSVSVFTSPMKCGTKEVSTSPVVIISDTENVSQNESTQEHEKECLELNNSNNLRSDNHTDFEIEMILNTMHMDHIITPIPRTPLRARNSEARNVPSRLSSIFENDNRTSEIEELKMDLNNMKNILKQHILLTSKQLSFNHEPLISKLVTDEDNLNAIHCMDIDENTIPESLLDTSEIRPESNLEISQSGLVPSPIDNELLFGSSQSSTERGADNAFDDNATRTSFPDLQDEGTLQNLEEEETTTEVNTETLEEISGDVNDSINQENSEVVNEESAKAVKVKRTKRKRLSKLDKLKNTLKPKYKIRSQTPIFKSLLKVKQYNFVKKNFVKGETLVPLNVASVPLNDTSVSLYDRAASFNETSATLNDKHVYEKAVKVMAELNSKQNSKARNNLSESVNKPVTLAPNEEHAYCKQTTQRLEVTQDSEVTSKPKQDELLEKHAMPLDDNITEVVTSKPQVSSKEVSQVGPTKTVPKKSRFSLSALFGDGESSSDSLLNLKESCKSPISCKPTKESVSTSETSPSSIMNDKSKSGNLVSSEATKENVSTSELSPSTIDNSKISNQTIRSKSPISSKTAEESMCISDTSQSSILNNNSKSDDSITEVVTFKPQHSSKEVSQEEPNKTVPKKSKLPLSALFDDGASDLVMDPKESCQSSLSSKPSEEFVSTSETSPLTTDNSKISVQTIRYLSPISSKLTEESLSISGTSPSKSDDNMAEVVTSKPQLGSKEVVSQEKPTNTVPKKSLLPLSDLFDDGASDLVLDPKESCQSSKTSKPTEESLSISGTSPSKSDDNMAEVVKSNPLISSKDVVTPEKPTNTVPKKFLPSLSALFDDGASDLVLDPKESCQSSISSKPTEESLSISGTSLSKNDDEMTEVVTSKPQLGSKEVDSQEKPTKTVPKKSLISLSDLFGDGESSSDSLLNPKESCQSTVSSKLTKKYVFTSETSSSSKLNYKSKNNNFTKRKTAIVSDELSHYWSHISKIKKEAVSTSDISLSTADNSKISNQAIRKSPILSEPKKESTIDISNDTIRSESPTSSKPTEESKSTSEISPSSILTEHCMSPISSKRSRVSLFSRQISPSSKSNNNSNSGNQTKLCKSPRASIPSKESLSTSETSPPSKLKNNSRSGNQNKHLESPLSPKPTKETSTSEISSSNILIEDSKSGNQTPPELITKQLARTQKSPSKINKMTSSSNDKQTGEDVNLSNSETSEQASPKSQIATRSKSKTCFVKLTQDPVILSAIEAKKSECQKDKVESVSPNRQASRKRKNNSSNEPEIQCKRILRSSTAHQTLSTENKEQSNAICNDNNELMDIPIAKRKEDVYESPVKQQKSNKHDTVISYDDLDLFSDNAKQSVKDSCRETQPQIDNDVFHPKQSILCCMIDKYGVENVRKFAYKKLPDATTKAVCEKIEQNISNIIASSPAESKNLMNRFVADLQKLNHKHFIAGLMKYLLRPERKIELFSKVVSPPAPPMTKAEQILIFVLLNLKTHWPSVDIVDAILSNIEYTVFKLNRTPDFNTIESISHLYALICRYFRAKSRLRLFILDAMYCIQFKAVPLIKQCLDVWMHIIPLAHMGIAKCPLVTCLVYLLHFYKCNDKFNRMGEIRTILSQKYFYQITDWNESKILDMFRNSIKDLKDVPIERKMLRIALIILAKRQGPKWCQNHIIKNLLLPMMEDKNTRENVKEFCVSMIGPLMKPYPVDMKVNCEIVMNLLTDMLNKEPSPQMEEAIITSMMFINRHNNFSTNKILLSRKMKPLSSELEGILREYVRAMPLKVWKKILSQLVRHSKFE